MKFLFEYETYKCVVIKDKTLGILYYSFVLLTLLYVGVDIVVEKAYIEYETPLCDIRTTLDKGRKDVDVATLPYCTNISCSTFELDEITSHIGGDVEVMITTALEEVIQARNCTTNDQDQRRCSRWATTRRETVYVAGVEDIELKIEHSILFLQHGSKANTAFSNTQLFGTLQDGNQQTLKKFDVGRGDKLKLSDVLHAADVTLETPSDRDGDEHLPMRDRGIVLHVFITYSQDTKTFGVGDIIYRYQVTRIPEMQYKIVDISNLGPEHRMKRKRKGIKIKFVQAGKIGKFSFGSLLVSIAAGLGLFTLITTFVDIMMLYILPLKLHYQSCKYESTDVAQKQKLASLEKKRTIKTYSM